MMNSSRFRGTQNSATLPPDITMPSSQQSSYFKHDHTRDHSQMSNQSTSKPVSSVNGSLPKCSPSICKILKSLRRKHPIGLPSRGQLRIDDETGESVRDNSCSVGKSEKRRGVSFSPSTLVWDAISSGSAQEVDLLLRENDVDVTQQSGTGDTFLHRAACEGNIEVIKTLISHGADPNQRSREGWPPLHYALQQAHLPAVIYLIECGTNMTEYTDRRVKEFVDVKERCSQVYKGEEVFV